MPRFFSLSTFALILAAQLTCACGGSDDGAMGTPSTAGGAGAAGAAGSAGAGAEGGSAGAGGVRTLDNCVTTFADDVPAFYKKYFRCVDVSMSGGDVVIKTSDLPPRKSPYYPDGNALAEEFDTQGGDRFKNPNRIAEQAMIMQIPADPKSKNLTIDTSLVDGSANNPNEYHFTSGTPGGVSLDGVAMFHGVAAPGDDLKFQEKSFDETEGHPEMDGSYHYHGATPGPLEVLKAKGLVTSSTPGQAQIELYAVMCDGTLVMGCTELDGSTPDSSAFDAQNGHVHDIAADGEVYFTGRYHTHVCRGKFADEFAPEIQYYSTCGATKGTVTGGAGGAGGSSGAGGAAGAGQGGSATGPQACSSTADCSGACPGAAMGCDCASTPMGSVCVPNCAADSDCPTGMNGQALACDASGLCAPKM
jgi:hypothetical protein